MSNILLIEDNEAIIMGLEYLFTNNGYNVRVARSAYQAKEILDNAKETEKYRTLIGAGDVWNIDIVILDVMLPDGDGFSLCRKIKADDIAPVIFLTAKDEEKDVVMGLELGADDYVIKPFRNMELLSRIKNVLRRNRSGNELTFADLKMDVDIRKLYKADNEVKLTKLEFEILKILLQNPKKVFTREEILSHIWDSAGNFVNDNTLTVTIKRLRDKIGDKEGNIISNGNNKVLKNNDPTAHAEVVAIREACKKLNTYDLSNYILYTSCEPCPMCLSAIIWANIKEVYYGCTKEDAGNIGFRDDIIYDYLKGNNKDLICLKQLDREECLETFKRYSEENGTIY